MIKIVQGFEYKQPVKNEGSKLVIKGDGIKYVLENTEVIDGITYIIASANETVLWQPGKYKYQILSAEGIDDSGEFEIIHNYLYADEYDTVKSQNEILLEAVEAQIAGKASSAQSSISVGDKSIGYCSIEELFKLRDYFKQKVAEESGKRSSDNSGKIKYKWTFR